MNDTNAINKQIAYDTTLHTEQKTKTIFSRRLALYLKEKGCKFVGTGMNPDKEGFYTWFFVEDENLDKAMDEYMRLLI